LALAVADSDSEGVISRVQRLTRHSHVISEAAIDIYLDVLKLCVFFKF